MSRIFVISLLLMLVACQPSREPEPVESAAEPVETLAPNPALAAQPGVGQDRLGRILDAQPEQMQARYDQRHPRETLEFFGIKPGMTVVEALPGGGWYSRILVPYLGAEGRLIGANYALDMWPLFPFGTEEFMAQMRQWPEQFPAQAQDWCEGDCARVSTFWLGGLPEEMNESADAVLLIRALHNLARFNDEHGYLDAALADIYNVLKPGCVVGVVQHWARDDMPDDWADGSNGYLKKQFVIDRFIAAGFKFVGESDINTNPDDQPSVDEYVWRLPPSLRLPEEVEDAETLRARYQVIGESHRMTLKFRKPQSS